MKTKASLLIATVALAFLVSSLPVYAELPFLGGWSYRRLITYDGVSGAGTGYVVFVKTYYASGIDSTESLTGGHKGVNASAVYLSGSCQSDFDDVRFTDNDAQTTLDYFLDSKTDSDYGLFAVEVSDNLNADCSFYIYYGNIEATSESNATSTFRRVISSGVALALPINEGANDILTDYSGNSNDGTRQNAPVWASGKHNQALTFDGTNQAATCDNVFPAAFTVGIWVYRIGDQAGDHCVIGCVGGGWMIELNGVRVRCSKHNGAYWWDTGYDLPINTWVHLTYSGNAAHEYFYVNGVPNVDQAQVLFGASVDTIYIGGVISSMGFNATITESFVFNSVLSDAAIADLATYYPQCSSANLGSLYLRGFVNPEPQPLYYGDEESAYVNSNDALAIGMLGFIFAIGAMGLVLLNKKR